jgi:phosphoribosylformylglycinamidine synthase
LATDTPGLVRAYDKPIMLAGGVGAIDRGQVKKLSLRDGDAVIVLGGPAMLIGLGGGAASSVDSGKSSEDLDFASVQRDNPEMERRCQEVIDRCAAQGELNPIRFMHDVGAGGLSNAIPELLHDSDVGGVIDLAKIPSDDPSLSPMQLWSNESQERYVLGVATDRLAEFEAICARERCPYAVVGHATTEQRLVVGYGVDSLMQPAFDRRTLAIDMPMDLLFGKSPKMHRNSEHPGKPRWLRLDTETLSLRDAGLRVLAHPTVAAKNFLVTIGDRTVGGLSARDQMVGPWQLPLADVAITSTDMFGYAGEAMAIGERTPLALLNAAASARIAVGEAITNLAAASVASLSEVKLSANWMAAASHPGEDALLFDAVKAVGLELCPALDISIPVGKDSLSMQAQWTGETGPQKSVSPVSLIVSAFARVADVRAQLLPVLSRVDDSELWLIGLGAGKKRLGGSVLAQCYGHFGGACPDLDDPARLSAFFDLIQAARADNLLLAYHDRSDGGAFAALCEMAFAAHLGLQIELDGWNEDAFGALFNEELGAVVQIAAEDRAAFADLVNRFDLTHCAQRIGRPISDATITISHDDEILAEWGWQELFDAWWSVTHAIQSLRDDPVCAEEEKAARRDFDDVGLTTKLAFDPEIDVAAPYINRGIKPRVAILREQGVNSQVEMAAAFSKAGFTAVDVHMSDLIAGRIRLDQFKGLAACGGFSYGDVLGAGRGWATSILERPGLREQFAAFFARPDSFSLGVCNGCQMLAQLKTLIPGAEHWPRFLRNRSEQFEARLGLVEIVESPSLFFANMAGSRLPIAVSHGEGRAEFDVPEHAALAKVTLRFIDTQGLVATTYPANPNGSPDGITGLTSSDGRSTLLMPHPERVHRSVQMSWHPADWGEASPWLRMFRNARVWVG